MNLSQEEFERLDELPIRTKERLLDFVVGVVSADVNENDTTATTILKEFKRRLHKEKNA